MNAALGGREPALSGAEGRPPLDEHGRHYNVGMARGWESKSVEAQQEEASDKSSRSGRKKMSAEEAAAFRENENLRLARQRVLQQLEASSNPRHQKVLQDALAALEEKLRRL